MKVQLPFSPSMVARQKVVGRPTDLLLPRLKGAGPGRPERLLYYGEETPMGELYRRAALFSARHPEILDVLAVVLDKAIEKVKEFFLENRVWRRARREYPKVLGSPGGEFYDTLENAYALLGPRWEGTVTQILNELPVQDELLDMIKATMLADIYSWRAGYVREGRLGNQWSREGWLDGTGAPAEPYISRYDVAQLVREGMESLEDSPGIMSTMCWLHRYMEIQAMAFPCYGREPFKTACPDLGHEFNEFEDRIKTFGYYDFTALNQQITAGRSAILRPRPGGMIRYSKKYAPLIKEEFLRFSASTISLVMHVVLTGAMIHRDEKKPKSLIDGDAFAGDDTDDGTGPIPWAPMEVARVPLVNIATQRSHGGIAPAASEFGVIPRHIHRMPIDGAIFDTPRSQRPGGTVLIDASGSMGWSEEDISSLASTCPNATVAIYSGNGGAGRLAILAEKGRCASSEDMQAEFDWGGGNECDGLALQWMVRQRRPFIWVCDGAVTVSGDSFHTRASLYCRDMIEQHGIFLVRNIDDARTLLSGRDCTGIGVAKIHGYYEGPDELDAADSFRVLMELRSGGTKDVRGHGA